MNTGHVDCMHTCMSASVCWCVCWIQLISHMPARILKLLEFIGFSGDRVWLQSYVVRLFYYQKFMIIFQFQYFCSYLMTLVYHKDCFNLRLYLASGKLCKTHGRPWIWYVFNTVHVTYTVILSHVGQMSGI